MDRFGIGRRWGDQGAAAAGRRRALGLAAVGLAVMLAACGLGRSELPPPPPGSGAAPAAPTPGRFVGAAPAPALGGAAVKVVSVVRGKQVPWASGTIRTRADSSYEPLVVTYERTAVGDDRIACGTIRDSTGAAYSNSSTDRPSPRLLACLFSVPRDATGLTWQAGTGGAAVALDGLIQPPSQ